jgi:anti-sigma regulatory factor (Ser/Thr protein kinase)
MMAADPDRHAELRLASGLGAPGQARDFLAAQCRSWGVPEFLERGALVISELVTNAVRHAGTDIHVALSLRGTGFTMTVHDFGRGEPHVVPPDQRVIGGRGLAMVDRLAESWGVDTDRDGKSVWCRLEAAAARISANAS